MVRGKRALLGLQPVLLLAMLAPLPELPDPLDPTPGFPKVGVARFADTASDPDAAAVWGSIDCERSTRHRLIPTGGDPHLRGDRAPQGNDGYRRLRLREGDDFHGERCELGRNDHRDSPVVVYREGDRLTTYLSLRLGQRFPIDSRSWQVVMQIKQSQPSEAGGGPPRLGLEVSEGRWRLIHHGPSSTPLEDATVWSAPAQAGVWTRFAFEGVYSPDPEVGSVRVSADLNGDGDARDPHERSDVARLQTLKPERAGGAEDGIPPGAAIPSHLRVGLYHHPRVTCPRVGCFVDVDNVGIYER